MTTYFATLVRALVCLVLLVVARNAIADGVYVCSNSSAEGLGYFACGDENTVITDAPGFNDLVAVSPPVAALGRQSFWYAKPPIVWQRWDTTGDASVIGICGGTERTLEKCAYGNGGNSALQVRSSIQNIKIPSPPWTYKKLDCTPSALSEVRMAVSWCQIGGVIYCDLPTGIKRESRVFNFCGNNPKQPSDFSGMSKSELNALDAQVINRAPTPAEFAMIVDLDRKYQPEARVVNSGYATAPMYASNADGTRGKISAHRYPVGAPCNWQKRLLAIKSGKPVGTDYYAVAVDGGTTLYATCKITGALSKP